MDYSFDLNKIKKYILTRTELILDPIILSRASPFQRLKNNNQKTSSWWQVEYLEDKLYIGGRQVDKYWTPPYLRQYSAEPGGVGADPVSDASSEQVNIEPETSDPVSSEQDCIEPDPFKAVR